MDLASGSVCLPPALNRSIGKPASEAHIMRLYIWARVLLLLSGLTLIGCTEAVAPATPTVAPTIALRVRLTFAGSTTVQPLAEKLAAAYHRAHPDVDLDIAAGGSVVGINAVQEGSVDIGMASRELKPEEQRPSIEPYQIAIDVLAIIVHPSNS